MPKQGRCAMRCKGCSAPSSSQTDSSTVARPSACASILVLASGIAPSRYSRRVIPAGMPLPSAAPSRSSYSARCSITPVPCQEIVMKNIFALALGTIVFLLAITAHDSPSTRIILGSVGLMLYAVALSPGPARGERKASWHRKPNKPRLDEFGDRPRQAALGEIPLTQWIRTSRSGGSR